MDSRLCHGTPVSRFRKRTLPNPLERPNRVFRDKRFGIAAGSPERRKIRRVARVAQGDADISQESAALDPFDRRTTKKSAKLSVVQGQVVT